MANHVTIMNVWYSGFPARMKYVTPIYHFMQYFFFDTVPCQTERRCSWKHNMPFCMLTSQLSNAFMTVRAPRYSRNGNFIFHSSLHYFFFYSILCQNKGNSLVKLHRISCTLTTNSQNMHWLQSALNFPWMYWTTGRTLYTIIA